MTLADTPEPPYVAVIFTSERTAAAAGEDYARMSAAMTELAARQPGYLGMESAHQDIGITVSYWRDEDSALAWKQVAAHQAAQQRGRERWYADYRVRVARVQREYSRSSSDFAD